MVPLCFVYFLHFWYWKIKNLIKMFSKDYFGILQCMFMTNFEVVSSKMTELWLFYILSIYCIFGIEKFEISKKNIFLRLPYNYEMYIHDKFQGCNTKTT